MTNVKIDKESVILNFILLSRNNRSIIDAAMIDSGLIPYSN